MKRIVVILLPLLLCCFANPVRAQEDRMDEVRAKLKLLVIADTTYLSQVDLTVSRMPIGELLRNVARASRVSIGYKGDENLMVNCNLSRAKITDLLFFLCQQYSLDLDVVGNIASVYPYVEAPPQIPGPRVSRTLKRTILAAFELRRTRRVRSPARTTTRLSAHS